MPEAQEARKLIGSLIQGRVMAECPCCGEEVRLKDAALFYLDEFSPDAEALYKQAVAEQQQRQRELRERRRKIPATSQLVAKATNLGLMLERIAPSLKSFRFVKNDCRSVFDPLDYVIFEGLSLRGLVSKILFVDIKSGNARLSGKQREIKDIITRKKVSWHTYMPEAGR